MKKARQRTELLATISMGEHSYSPIGVTLPNNILTEQGQQALVTAAGLLYQNFKHRDRVLSLLDGALVNYRYQSPDDAGPFFYSDNEIRIQLQRTIRIQQKLSLWKRVVNALFKH